MREKEFENFLISDSNIISKRVAVRSRVNKGRMIERYFNISLDTIVSEDEIMCETLMRIKIEIKDTNGTFSNALRKYYKFINAREFPTLRTYKDCRWN